MILTRSPYRLSFFGGSTDYKAFAEKHGGAVLSTSIDKYCWISIRKLPPFFDHRSRIVWSEIELIRELDEIHHPSVRECLRFTETQDVEIHHLGDLPARSGIGSSSSFTVGLLNALYTLKGRAASKKQLARDAIYIEQEILKECVGAQDQIAAAFGGFNRITFNQDGSFAVSPLVIPPKNLELLQQSLMLIYTGLARNSGEIASEQVANFAQREPELKAMKEMVDTAQAYLGNEHGIEDFGRLLDEAWRLKKTLGQNVTTNTADEIYLRAKANGALGGKISGAGGGGVFLLFVPPENREAVKRALPEFLEIPFAFDRTGSQVIYYEPEQQEGTIYRPEFVTAVGSG